MRCRQEAVASPLKENEARDIQTALDEMKEGSAWLTIVFDIHDSVHIEAHGLGCHGAHLVGEAVGVLAISNRRERMSSGIHLLLVSQHHVVRPCDPEVDVQVATSSHLVGHRHAVLDRQRLKVAIHSIRLKVDRMRRNERK